MRYSELIMAAARQAIIADDLGKAVDRLLAESGSPPVWSLIVTIFGDMAAPRGGVVSTATLIRLLGLVGVAPPAVRTALSRLVADGWLENLREGRLSRHRMTASAAAETAEASRRIYGRSPAAFGGGFEIVTSGAGQAQERQGERARMAAAGFGMLPGDVFVRPMSADAPTASAGPAGFRFRQAVPADGEASALVAAAYDLSSLRERQLRFLDSHGGLLDSAMSRAPGPADAVAARLLLIHGHRRLALRDPGLPSDLLPTDWPAAALLQRVAEAYRALIEPSEAWLDEQAEDALPGGISAAPLLHARFA